MRIGGRWAARLLFAAVALLVFVGLGPATGTYRLATVLSGSMAPGMPVGSVAVLVPEPPAAVRVGDVITFQAPTPDHAVVTHRVVEVVEGGLQPVVRTKGDANRSPDPWTARLQGNRAWRRVAVVPFAGTAIRFLRSPTVHHLSVHIAPALLLLCMLGAIWFPGRKRPAAPAPVPAPWAPPVRINWRPTRLHTVGLATVFLVAMATPAAATMTSPS
ncbi:MAG TPA: signal peptidase I, partial [Acidimicrobiia bacterium]|nr:signal peptidase I [Acidimicrobiia bacterium]